MSESVDYGVLLDNASNARKQRDSQLAGSTMWKACDEKYKELCKMIVDGNFKPAEPQPGVVYQSESEREREEILGILLDMIVECQTYIDEEGDKKDYDEHWRQMHQIDALTTLQSKIMERGK